MQDDGNLVLYDSLSNPVWASSTHQPYYSSQNPIPKENYTAPPPYGSPELSMKDMKYNQEMKMKEQQFTMGNFRSSLTSPAMLSTSEFLKAPNRDFYARLQEDGNLVIFTSTTFSNANALWSSNSGGKGEAPFTLRTQDDGNLVIYDRTN
jgi:hypothetical protein